MFFCLFCSVPPTSFLVNHNNDVIVLTWVNIPLHVYWHGVLYNYNLEFILCKRGRSASMRHAELRTAQVRHGSTNIPLTAHCAGASRKHKYATNRAPRRCVTEARTWHSPRTAQVCHGSTKMPLTAQVRHGGTNMTLTAHRAGASRKHKHDTIINHK